MRSVFCTPKKNKDFVQTAPRAPLLVGTANPPHPTSTMSKSTMGALALSLPPPPSRKQVKITFPPSAIPLHLKTGKSSMGVISFSSSIWELRSCDSHTMSPRIPCNYSEDGHNIDPGAKPSGIVLTHSPTSILLSPRMEEGEGL